MFGFLGRRLLSGVVLVFAITTLAFLLLYLGSGDIARRILGQTATHEQVAAKAAELGLDRPIWEQYVSWLSGALTETSVAPGSRVSSSSTASPTGSW